MRIEYIVQARMPTEKAHGLQIAHMCQAFAEQGHEVRLVVPNRRNPIVQSVFDYYGVKKNFQILYLSALDLVSRWGRLGAFVHRIHSALFVTRLAFFSIPHDALVYTRSAEIAWLFALRGYRVVCEVHDWPESYARMYAWLLKDVTLLPCNSPGTEAVVRAHGLSRTMVAHNGIDLAEFSKRFDRVAVRKKLGLPLDKKIVMYIGALEKWKGVETLCQAADVFPEDTIAAIIGGGAPEVASLQATYPRVCFLGSRPYRDLAENQQAADVLVVPNIPTSRESSDFTSPIKLFAHMASGIPIVVSDLPSLRAIVDETGASFFRAGDRSDLARVILDALRGRDDIRARTNMARKKSEAYTWTARAQAIFSHLLASK
jgi:glycosyltransferase involved in cell wall biosynthesis